MAIHNWVRCHWRNGRHDLHDLPDEWCASLESHLSRQRTRADDLGVVRLASVDALAVAWVECEVPLGAGECGFTYRRARAVHALVRPMASGGAWNLQEAESLLGQRYGEPVSSGLAAQHPALSHLDFPEDGAQALGLFVGREDPLPSELVGASPAAPVAVADVPASPTRHADESAPAITVPAPSDDASPVLERWLERFTLLSRRRPAASVTEVDRSDAPAQAVAVSSGDGSRAIPETVPAPPEVEAGDEMVSEARAEEAEESAVGPQALFDLSTPSAQRPSPPPSSLSGLLGPSHTTAC